MLGQAFNQMKVVLVRQRDLREKHLKLTALIKRRQRFRMKMEALQLMLGRARKQ